MVTILSIRRAGLILATATIALFLVLQSGTFASADSLSFSGSVLTPAGGSYDGGGGVNLFNNSRGYWSGIGVDGSFSITGIEPGTYTLDVGLDSSSSYAKPAQQQVTITSDIAGFRISVAVPVITGILANPDGTPTSGCVNVRNSTWTVHRDDCPNSTGVFKIGSLDAGTYILETSPPQHSSYVSSSQTVSVTDPAVTLDLGTVKLDTPFVIGKVALPDGSLIPWNDDYNQRIHLSVDLWNEDRTIDKHSDYDNSSQFKFGSMPPGTYTIHVNVWDTELYTGSQNVSITVPSAGVDLSASPIRISTPQLSGIVYRPDGVTPLQNAWVQLHSDDWSLSQGSSSDANGKYRIGGLPPGTYMFEVNPPNDANDMVRPDAEDVTVTAGLTTKNVTLSAAKKFVTGTVKKKDGTSVSCAQVNASRRGGNGWANSQTNSAGAYALTVAPGSWNIRVEPNRNFDCPAADWVYLDGDAVVEFSDSNTTQSETVNFTVQKATAIITGTVKKKDGTPVTNGNVNANSQTQDGRSRWSNAQIKADGSYQLLLVGGTYDLNIWTQDTTLFTRNQKVSVSDNQTVTVNFSMTEKLAHIKGRVMTKVGVGLPNIQLNGNLDCGPQGCSAWSNTKTDANGYYDLAATAGRWNINFDSGQNTSYVYDGQPKDVYVPTETSTVDGNDFVLVYADVTVRGKVVDESGKAFTDFSGWAYVRPLTATSEQGNREFGGSVNQGIFTIRIPSSLFSTAELGIHVPSNSQYSALPGQKIVIVADATIEQNIMVKKNDAAIVGRIIDSSGLPLSSCNFRGEVFVNASNSQWFGTQINADCSYEITLLAGTYRLGYNIDQSAGFLNRPPKDEQITVASGTRVQKDITVLAGDSRASVLVLNPDGTPARRVWVWADNHEEVDQMRQSGDQGQGQEEFRGPGGTNSPEEVLKFCSKSENEKECQDFKLPPGSEGPGGCKDALACTKYCQKHQKECAQEFSGDAKKTSVQSVSVLQRKSRIAGLKLVRAQGDDGKKEEDDFFDNMLQSGTETNDTGVATLSLLSGHAYTVNAGLPPDSKYMPPKTARVDFQNTKSATVTLQLRESDGRMTGFVTHNGVAVRDGWVGCWSEDGNSNGSQIINGTYSLNYTFNSTYHCNANASTGTTFLRSDEAVVTIGKEKSKKYNFAVGEAKFQIPPPVSESFDSTQPHVITLADGTTINISANTIASSGTVTVNANPTINIQSQKTAQPLGYGYSMEAVDANGQAITKFNGNITMCFKYTDAQLEDNGVEEASLVPSYWDTASGTWKKPANVTHDTEDNTVCVTSDHFSAYAVVGTSGNGRGRSLRPVKITKSKGITQLTIGSGSQAKKVKPFPTYKGEVTVGTANIGKSGQVVIAVQAGTSTDATTMKVYDLKGKLKQKITPWGSGYRKGASALQVDDVTKDSWDDFTVSPVQNRTVKVYNLKSKKSYTIDSGGSGRVVAQPLDLQKNGSKQLVTKIGSTVRVWSFNGKRYAQTGFDMRKLSISEDSIERVTLRPTITSLSPKTLKTGNGTMVITVKGTNLGSGSRVLFNNSIPAKKVVASGSRMLKVTVNRSAFERNKKYSMTIINSDGGQITSQRLLAK